MECHSVFDGLPVWKKIPLSQCVRPKVPLCRIKLKSGLHRPLQGFDLLGGMINLTWYYMSENGGIFILGCSAVINSGLHFIKASLLLIFKIDLYFFQFQ